ncbi:3-methyl-2-oxobutanoate hydroxymethyltransferase [Flaviflexus salsibiostraticola]|uniref:3-methyl-2-oxobutanoate hydroxymethyltransferase n=1 Tax=Flaviflexus salsibiostraticola TaxID=1282737 RepID=A0A3Q8WS77_9ACTO|nr:3-methyl-2-oxobutanoate hydroxymethyltransferase [Flaviflexus salsibiostraticola]AZN29046.1 3-methyl-2-oxobutanoate hydroxymethyltransferase [Flaviflexus salsibiostraticola]
MTESAKKPARPRRVRIAHLHEAKTHGDPLTMLTAYDAIVASIFDRAGVDMLLVGDSIGTTMFGEANTLGVELADMVRATKSVAKGTERALVVADLPFGTYESSPEQAFASAAQLIKAGAHAVKLEGGVRVADQIRQCATHGIPVIGHIGFTPQAENALSGPRIQGRGEEAADRVIEDAVAVQEAGASAVVLEMVPAELAERITSILTIPTIGIGAGPGTDGQVLVWTDMVAMTDWQPSFVRIFGEIGTALQGAATDYVDAVKDRSFPTREHSF